MDKSTYIPGAPEVEATPITPAEMLAQATVVFDRVTGQAYNPQEAFDKLLNKPEIMAVFKRLAVR